MRKPNLFFFIVHFTATFVLFFYAASSGVKSLGVQLTVAEKILTFSGYLAASPVVPLVTRFAPEGQLPIIILLLLNSLFWTIIFSLVSILIKKKNIRKN